MKSDSFLSWLCTCLSEWLSNSVLLVLHSNPGIQELPAELGQLSNLWQLDIEELNISNVPADVCRDGTAWRYTRFDYSQKQICFKFQNF